MRVELPIQSDICPYLAIATNWSICRNNSALVQNLSALKVYPHAGEPKSDPPPRLDSLKGTRRNLATNEFKEINIGTVDK